MDSRFVKKMLVCTFPNCYYANMTIINRILQKQLEASIKQFPVVTVTGPRQSGKTTLLRETFSDYTYVNLENLDQRAAAAEDPRSFLHYHKANGLIIDEAQHVPELFSYLQQIVDENRQMGQYILTGSQNFLLLEKISQSLAGRVAVHHLLPFEFTELQADSELQQHLDQLMFTGLYPAIYDRSIPAEKYFPSYLQTYIERDVRSLTKVGDLNTFRRFLQLCAGRTGQLLNFANMANELSIDAKTVKAWLSILEASFIVFLLPPYYKNFNKRIVKHPKLYFYDTGVICSLLGLTDFTQLATHYLRGALFENLIISEYVKGAHHRGRPPGCYFWRDNSGNEVDLLIDRGGELTAVEIKSGATVRDDFFKNLVRFRKYSGTAVENCYLVHGGDTAMPRKNANVLPWRTFTSAFH